MTKYEDLVEKLAADILAEGAEKTADEEDEALETEDAEEAEEEEEYEDDGEEYEDNEEDADDDQESDEAEDSGDVTAADLVDSMLTEKLADFKATAGKAAEKAWGGIKNYGKTMSGAGVRAAKKLPGAAETAEATKAAKKKLAITAGATAGAAGLAGGGVALAKKHKKTADEAMGEAMEKIAADAEDRLAGYYDQAEMVKMAAYEAFAEAEAMQKAVVESARELGIIE